MRTGRCSYVVSPMLGGTMGNTYINPTPNGGHVASPMLGGTLPNAFDDEQALADLMVQGASAHREIRWSRT